MNEYAFYSDGDWRYKLLADLSYAQRLLGQGTEPTWPYHLRAQRVNHAAIRRTLPPGSRGY